LGEPASDNSETQKSLRIAYLLSPQQKMALLLSRVVWRAPHGKPGIQSSKFCFKKKNIGKIGTPKLFFCPHIYNLCS
jgi:hypothetical protein